ncbi:MAG: DeoR family transcriptional regulator, partial [Bacteroidetes bacterium]|nr:DeoR family transcriptional regulator [Bacteroidota bacterium]
CPIAGIDTLVTELDPNDPALEPYRQAGIDIL